MDRRDFIRTGALSAAVIAGVKPHSPSSLDAAEAGASSPMVFVLEEVHSHARRVSEEAPQRRVESPPTVCDICGSNDVREIKCKVICGNCGTILKSCADL